MTQRNADVDEAAAHEAFSRLKYMARPSRILRFLVEASEPGQVLELPYRWRREDFTAMLAARGAGQPAG